LEAPGEAPGGGAGEEAASVGDVEHYQDLRGKESAQHT
jgi:hypothetical protein